LIQSACRHEARALLLQRKLRNEVESLTTDQYLAVLRDLSAATEARDRALKGLKLDEPIRPLDLTICPTCKLSFFGGCTCVPIPSTIPPAATVNPPAAEDRSGSPPAGAAVQSVEGESEREPEGQGAKPPADGEGDRT
jgi:hypothetical protein